MQKPEPYIIAPGYTDDEICDWMERKATAIRLLKKDRDSVTELRQKLAHMERESEGLAKDAAVMIGRVTGLAGQQQAFDGEVMKSEVSLNEKDGGQVVQLKDLPVEVQIIAAETLKEVLTKQYCITERPDKLPPLLREIFISLYCQNEHPAC
ncbi:TPA: hypothetical protein U0S14_003473 [Escherichia coli]|nr:hypothetical protein [Escherichia coli]